MLLQIRDAAVEGLLRAVHAQPVMSGASDVEALDEPRISEAEPGCPDQCGPLATRPHSPQLQTRRCVAVRDRDTRANGHVC